MLGARGRIRLHPRKTVTKRQLSDLVVASRKQADHYRRLAISQSETIDEQRSEVRRLKDGFTGAVRRLFSRVR